MLTIANSIAYVTADDGNPTPYADTIDSIYICATNWVSEDADDPATPARDWQEAWTVAHSAPELLAALQMAIDAIENAAGGRRDQMDADERHAVDVGRAAIAAATE